MAWAYVGYSGSRRISSINNIEMLQDEIELLKSLEQITIAINLNQSGEKSTHPITNVYNNLRSEIAPASPLEHDFIRDGFIFHIYNFIVYGDKWVNPT